MAALDAKKAFDRVNHVKLFTNLLDKGLSMGIVRLLVDWYSKIYAAVKWEGCISSLFCIKSAVRQGGVLSPALLNMYITESTESKCWRPIHFITEVQRRRSVITVVRQD